MFELPEFTALKVTQSARAPSRASLDAFDHVAVIAPKNPASGVLRALPQSKQLERLLRRAVARGAKHVSARIDNDRGTGMTLAVHEETSAFARLTWARRVLAACLEERPGKLAIVPAGLDAEARAAALSSLVAAAEAAAFELPSYKRARSRRERRLASVRLFGSDPALDLRFSAAEAFGNNVARWFTALPPNELTAGTYRRAIEKLARAHGVTCKFIGERELEKLGAGAFLAVASGNAERDAGILHLTYRPARETRPALALVGKGILFDTGGTNLKPFKGMLDMHTDMQGSAVALGTLLALARLKAPYRVDAWLAVTENRLSATAYKSQDVVRAADGTSIQVIHTDAEGRMALADALVLASRDEPRLLMDYATLTGSCVSALTEKYSGVFSNREAAGPLLIRAGAESGERVWPFPMDADFDEALKSNIADIKQCAVENEGDHILAARFLSRFVPRGIPWIHVDLSAGQHKDGLAHVPTEITGFGVRFTLELLRRHEGPAALAEALAA